METLNFIFSSNDAISESYDSGSPNLLSDALTDSSPETQFNDFKFDELFNLSDQNLHNGSVQDHEYCLQENMDALEQNYDFSTLDTNIFDIFDSNIMADPLSNVQTELRGSDLFLDFSPGLMEPGGNSPNTSDESFQNFESFLIPKNSAKGTLIMVPMTNQVDTHRPQCTIITEDEQALLIKEGINLPVDVPLTRDEERVLKVVRRKIRNKISAKVSRMKKQSYVEGLEQRIKICSQQNKELQNKVDKLQKQNLTLAVQLKKLQGLLFQPRVTVIARKMQAGGCLMVLLLSMALFVLPSMAPWMEEYNNPNRINNLEVVPSSLSTGRKILQEPSLLKMDYMEEFGFSPNILFGPQKTAIEGRDLGTYYEDEPPDDGVFTPEHYVIVIESHNYTTLENFGKSDL